MTDEHEHAMKVAKVIAKAMGDNFSDAFKNLQRWTAKCGMSGGGFRDVNEPFQDDYIAAAQAAAAVIAADRAGLVARIAELEGTLRKANEPQWFYLGDDCSSDQCRSCIDECISEDFECDNHRNGDHVLHISGARPVPDMWVALHYFTDAEKDERQDDEPYAYTVHATENEARAALKGTRHDADA